MIEQIIEKRLTISKDYIYGFASLKGLLADEYKEYPYGISIGKRLDNTIVDSIKNGPTIEYFNHYRDINTELTNVSTSICDELRKENIHCISIVPTVSSTSDEFKPYLKTLRYKVSHKMVATRAGLGWIGKTDLFISKDFGARVRLVSILIDTPVKITRQTIDKSKCGKCNICVDKCPAQASNGILWDTNIDRDVFFDAHKCREKCGELAKLLLNKDSRICGICVSVCPIGKLKRNN
jgi:epoxyqueuosine reductase QueG